MPTADQPEGSSNSDLYTSVIEIEVPNLENTVFDERNNVDSEMFFERPLGDQQELSFNGDLCTTTFEIEVSNIENTMVDETNHVDSQTFFDTVHSVGVRQNNYTGGRSTAKARTRSSKKKCAAEGCEGSLSNRYFSFPAIIISDDVQYGNLERCKTWVQNCGNLALLGIETDKLHCTRYLCSEHFNDHQFYNSNRKTLLPNAVPSEFVCNPLSDLQMKLYPILSIADGMMRAHLFSPGVMVGNDTDDNGSEGGDRIDLNNIQALDKHQLIFENDMHSLKWITCPRCKEKFSKPANSNVKCQHSKNNCSMYTAENDMDPLDVPEVLKSLSYIEEQLIAMVHPLISVFKLSGHHQYGYRGNIINFPQDVKSFAKTLPHNIDDLPSLITVRTKDDIKPVDFHVRAGKVRDALLWLRGNNPFYHDVELSEENISKLPEDGNVFQQVTRVINVDSTEDSSDEPDISSDDEDHVEFLIETCVPSLSLPTTSDKAETVLNWPAIGNDAVNEFKTQGYIAMAFPTLFPYGKADLRNPRERNVTPSQYFKHLLQYHDERFAKHPRFRYFALNSTMRWNALKNGGVFVKKNSTFKHMDLNQLKEELRKNPSLLKKILFYNSNLRGTRSYWYAKGQELLAMVEQLGLPTLFFTLSAADLHWPDLYHHLAPDEDINTMSDVRRRKLIEENPLKVDTFFLKRGEKFISEVLKSKYNVNDLWFRIEYQHRGSPHIHGVLWLAGAPKFDDLTKESAEKLFEIAEYFDQYISTSHPDIHCPKGPIHPSRLRLSEVIDLKKDLAELLNRVQRHTEHREGYCWRKNRKTKKSECRFKFPKDFAAKTEIKRTEDNDVELVTARNDKYLNKYNAYIMQTWRANIDVSPVLSRRALVNYLAKYVTKSETKSKEMSDILQILMDKSDSDKSVKSIVQQLYIQSCCERDISAQETCHLLMGLPLVSTGGRKFVNLNFKVLDSDAWAPVLDDETKNCKSYIEKYMERSDVYENQSLWYMARNIMLPSGRRHRPGNEAIIQVYPRLSKNVKDSDLDRYYRQQVLLFIPWRYEEQILQKYDSWEEAYKANETLINESYQPKCDLDGQEPDDPEYEDVDPEPNLTAEQWMCVSRMGPSQTAEQVELGRREIDLNHNWHEASDRYREYGGVEALTTFLALQKKNIPSSSSDVPSMPSVEFSSEQKTVLDLLKLQIESIKTADMSSALNLPKSVIVQGKAGTGKSLLIHAMKSMIHDAFGHDAYILLGPTGVSALNINGSTVHSKLYIHPKTKEVLPLTGTTLHEFREKFEKTLFVIVDEYSMVGCNMLSMIEKRLKEALDRDDERYGGAFIYFFGDIQQLAPVGDSPAYKNNQVSINYVNGKLLYETIEAAVVLSQVKRQSDEEFVNVLSNISTGTVTNKDYKILQKRFTSSVSLEEKNSFKDAIRLYPTRKEVDDYNRTRIECLKNPSSGEPMPIARIPAHHNCVDAKGGSETEAGGLNSVLYLAKGAKIMLRANLWTEKGLVNGAVGTIVDILYKEGTNPPEDAPAAIICRFDSYKGPYINDADKTIVITPITKQWKSKNGKDCVREQFPISLCYACSIHKSQGLTLEKAYANIGVLKEMSPGLTYTALSRVKSLSGLLLEPFGLKRLLSLNDKQYIKDRVNWIGELCEKQISNFTS